MYIKGIDKKCIYFHKILNIKYPGGTYTVILCFYFLLTRRFFAVKKKARQVVIFYFNTLD